MGKWRAARDWIQEKLAEEAGVTAATISRIETGKPYSHDSLESIAEAFKIEPFELFLDPTEATQELMKIIFRMTEADRAHALRVLKVVAEKAA